MKEVGAKQLRIIGTGFWITRYGLLATAKHVVEDLADEARTSLGTAFVCHLAEGDAVHLRQLRRAHLLQHSAC
jgi:S1-C subfamily serine protease